MAWNAYKTELLKALLQERMLLTKRLESVEKYGITKTALQVIGSHCDEATRQAILNELIDDKVAMLSIDKAGEQGKIDAMTGTQADLNTHRG